MTGELQRLRRVAAAAAVLPLLGLREMPNGRRWVTTNSVSGDAGAIVEELRAAVADCPDPAPLADLGQAVLAAVVAARTAEHSMFAPAASCPGCVAQLALSDAIDRYVAAVATSAPAGDGV